MIIIYLVYLRLRKERGQESRDILSSFQTIYNLLKSLSRCQREIQKLFLRKIMQTARLQSISGYIYRRPWERCTSWQTYRILTKIVWCTRIKSELVSENETTTLKAIKNDKRKNEVVLNNDIILFTLTGCR